MGKQYANEPLERCAESRNAGLYISYASSVTVLLVNFLGNKIISLNLLTLSTGTEKT